MAEVKSSNIAEIDHNGTTLTVRFMLIRLPHTNSEGY